MNCLNRYQMQAFIDKEVSEGEQREFTNHIAICNTCRELSVLVAHQSQSVKRLLAGIDMENEQIPIPAFTNGNSRFKQKKLVVSLTAAASILILAGSYFALRDQARLEPGLEADAMIQKYLYEADANKLWNDKQAIITVTDENGNIIYTNIND